ncbi:self-incompatibility protein S1-like [Arachis stenosperma]|uniref:self-incompatibility protein S1-like n=1 Tax=Arachis stenosperma TaxID=217475 RepID=UPI0025AD51FA|nr:self-incompatibility protein S1-like [Arachis stenosperma]
MEAYVAILAKITYLVALLFLVIGLCTPIVVEAKHVSIKNRLGSGKNMTLHCKSKDTDLGEHSIAYGDEFGWDFHDDVVGTTLFYCDLEWERVQEYHFDAYDFHRDFVRCGSDGCSWLISAEGMYGSNSQTGIWEFMYYWPN